MEKILLRDSPKKISYYASCLQIPKVRICLVIKNFTATNRAKLADGCFLSFPQNRNDFFCHGCQMHLEKTLPLTYSSDKIGNPVFKKINSLTSTLITLKLCVNRMSTVVTSHVTLNLVRYAQPNQNSTSTWLFFLCNEVKIDTWALSKQAFKYCTAEEPPPIQCSGSVMVRVMQYRVIQWVHVC